MSAVAAHVIGLPDGDQPVQVLIADDHPLLLAGLRRALERDDQLQIVGEARSGPELVALVDRRLPDIVLLDLRMPGVVGTECIQTICTNHPHIKCVVLSAESDPAIVEAALDAGAAAYLVKSVLPNDIAALVRQVAKGAVFHAPTRAGESSGPAPDDPALTPRERSILAAVADGKTTAMISKELWVSEHTIKFHLTNIYRKLNVQNRAGAVKYAIENQL